MKRWLARHVFYPVQDLLCGRHSLEAARALQTAEQSTPQQLLDIQHHKLRRLLQHAFEHVPYYATLFLKAGINISKIESVDDLSQLYVLTKDDIRHYREDMVSHLHRGRLIESCTSGSTGSPLIFHVCRQREQADVAARIRAHQWFDIQPGDPAIYLWGSRIEINNQDRWRMFRDWLINERLLSAFTLTDEQLHRYANIFHRVKPDYVYSYASSMWRFGQFVEQCRPELKGAIRKVAFTSGEYLLPQWREEIIRYLECSVAEEYGCREGGLIAHECPCGSFHIMAENIIVEVLDDNDQPLPPDREGRIVITNLEAYGMPFIRYDTGDRAALRSGTCECGLSLPMMHKPSGRTFEMLETNNGTKLTGVSLSRDLKEVDGISHYRVIQESRHHFRILLVTNFRYQRRFAEDKMRRIIQGRIGPNTSLDLVYVDELPPHPSGKYHYVVNAIKP